MIADTGSSSHEFYVAPDGDDKRWTGRVAEPAPDGKDGPLASIEGAQKAVRKLRDTGALRGPVTVWLRGGRYFLDKPVVFTPEDSCPVTYASYPGEEAVLDGGRRIDGWREEEVNGRTVWVADIPDAAEGKWYFYQLFVDGRRRPRARLPKEASTGWRACPASSPNRCTGGPRSMPSTAHRGTFRTGRTLPTLKW